MYNIFLIFHTLKIHVHHLCARSRDVRAALAELVLVVPSSKVIVNTEHCKHLIPAEKDDDIAVW
jgi:hypothetical protein